MEFLLTLRRRGIADQAVLRAMDEVPREYFVETAFARSAYADQALPIACGQTISQPYVVAYMTEQLDVHPEHRVLEVAGVQDILTKCIGTSNPHNVIHATIDALQQLRSPDAAAKLRDKRLEEVRD